MSLASSAGKPWTQFRNHKEAEFIAMASDIRYELMVGGIYPIYYAAMANKWMKENKVTEEDVATHCSKKQEQRDGQPKGAMVPQ